MQRTRDKAYEKHRRQGIDDRQWGPTRTKGSTETYIHTGKAGAIGHRWNTWGLVQTITKTGSEERKHTRSRAYKIKQETEHREWENKRDRNNRTYKHKEVIINWKHSKDKTMIILADYVYTMVHYVLIDELINNSEPRSEIGEICPLTLYFTCTNAHSLRQSITLLKYKLNLS